MRTLARIVLRSKNSGASHFSAANQGGSVFGCRQGPDDLAEGEYELFIHNGFGGTAGWSAALPVRVKLPDAWPEKVFNVRDFGAKGDDVADDTAAIREALAAAEKNGGGVVYFPWGTYRLNDWIGVPEKTILRGEVRDGSVLKWPVDPIKSDKDFSRRPFSSAPLRHRRPHLDRAQSRGHHLRCADGTQLLAGDTAGVRARIRPWGQGRDLFLRRLNVQHWLLAGRPEQQKPVQESWPLQKQMWEGKQNLRLIEGGTIEISDCLFQGGTDNSCNLSNARITRNQFANTMGYCWTNLGGGARHRL